MTGTVQDNLGTVIETAAVLFEALIESNVAVSRRSEPPASHASLLKNYALENPRDGVVLLAGQERVPICYTGGWLLALLPGAEAITLDRHIFSKTPLTVATYVHEVAHVGQYGCLGIAPFLVSYFAESTLEVVRRFLKRESLNVMRSNRLEDEAYDIELRFRNWCRRKSYAAA